MAVERLLMYLYTGDYKDVDDGLSEEQQVKSKNESLQQEAEAPSSEDHQANDSRSESPSSSVQDAIDKAANAMVHVKVPALANNVLVYALADKYDIGLLQSLAQTKFEMRAADQWGTANITSILSKVYASIPATNSGLRTVMLQVCLRYMEGLMQDEAFQELLQGDAAMCFDVLWVVQKQNSERAVYSEVISAREARFHRVTEWTKTQEKGFKQIVLANTVCGQCARPLDLSVANGATTDWILVAQMLRAGRESMFCQKQTGAGGGLILTPWRKYVSSGCFGIKANILSQIQVPRIEMDKGYQNKGSSIDESTTNRIHLPEDDPTAMERLLQYLYTADYDDTDSEDDQESQSSLSGSTSIPAATGSPSTSTIQANINISAAPSSTASNAVDKTVPVQVSFGALANNALVYALADKYDMPLLKLLAKEKFQTHAADQWTTDDIISIMPIIYSTTPDSDRGLRQIMLNVCLRSTTTNRLMAIEPFQAMLKRDSSMCFDILAAVSRRGEERDAQLIEVAAGVERMMEWSKVQDGVIKTFAEYNRNCFSCSRVLDLVLSQGVDTDWQGPLVGKCRHCGVELLSKEVGSGESS
ncbi:MAG: hypothetical protein Q9168_003603 [Polycauliona sp. 1 TL-2023]